MANGFITVFGQQISIASGNNNDGPFQIPYSTTFEQITIAQSVTNTATPVPIGSQGVIVYPGSADVNLSLGFISSDLTRISPLYPSVIAFDTTATPSNVYMTTAGTSGVACTLRFF